MENHGKFWYLRHHNFFDQLTDEEIEGLCIITGFKSANKNEFMYFEDLDNRLYFLKRGVIKIIQLDEEGNEKIIDLIQQCDIFGQIGLGTSSHHDTEYAKVLSDEAAVCSFKVADFEKVLSSNSNLSLRFTKQVGNQFKFLQSRYNDLVFKDVRTRVIDFMKDFAKKFGRVEGKLMSTPNFLTHQDIADLIGATRQTVTSILNDLNKQGKILYTRRKIVIPNIENFK
jgi:CRP/FNR family transcriptional regulator, cyclic AMP receptor protein